MEYKNINDQTSHDFGMDVSNINNQNEEDHQQHMRLMQIKQERKMQEQNALKLQNWIRHLEQEKGKMIKKISEVWKKAIKLLEVKKQKEEDQQILEIAEKQKEEEFNKKQEEIKQAWLQNEKNLVESKVFKITESINQIQTAKLTIQQLREKYQKQKQATLENNAKQALEIKEQKIQAKLNQEIKKMDIQQQAKQRYVEEVNQEILKKLKIEDQIKSLQEKENELIEILKQTNAKEFEEYEQLEKILNSNMMTTMDIKKTDNITKEVPVRMINKS